MKRPVRPPARSGHALACRGRAFALALAALAAAAPALAKDAKPAERPTAEMQAVFEAVSHLLPIAMSEQAWASPDRRAEVQQWLDALAKRSALLEKHGMSREVGFQHLSRSLASDVEEVRERFRLGRYEESRFFMIEATGNCVACHSRLPSEKSFPMANRLLARIDLDALSVHERTQILVATRQFDEAMETWEKMFADTSVSPGELDLGGYLLDYLTVGLRVERNPARVRGTIAKLAARPDVPLDLQRHLAGWIRALEASTRDVGSGDRLARARALIEGRQLPTPAPLTRDQTVYDLVASGLLLELLDDAATKGPRRAEAYYLLGLVESRTVDSHWVPQAEVHLEAAIRLAPEAPFAEDAYAVLEEYIIVGWGGASSTDLPAQEWAKLRELRALIDAHAADLPTEASR